DTVAASLSESVVDRSELRRQGNKNCLALRFLSSEFRLIGCELRVESGKRLVAFPIQRIDLVRSGLELLLDLLNRGKQFYYLCFERCYLLLQRVYLAHRRFVFFLVLRVLQVPVGSLEIRLYLG